MNISYAAKIDIEKKLLAWNDDEKILNLTVAESCLENDKKKRMFIFTGAQKEIAGSY